MKIGIIFLFALFLFLPADVSAALLPSCTLSGNCYSCHFIELFENIADFILKVFSAFSVLTFVVGGIFWIISGGSPEKVQMGQKIMVGTVIGISLVLGGYMIVNFTIASFLGAPVNSVKLFGTDWSSYCASGNSPVQLIKDCTKPEGVNFGVCGTPSCSEDCVCYNKVCINSCAALATEAGKTGTCVAAPVDCTGEKYDETGAYCPAATPVCCRK